MTTATPECKYKAITPWRLELERLVSLYGGMDEKQRFANSDEWWLDLGGEG